MSNIRVNYSGLIAFLFSMISVGTGMIFVVIVTRKLTQEEFGLWALIGTMVSYIAIIQPIISYWTIREIARGEKVGKTSVLTASSFSLVGFTIFSILALSVSSSLGLNYEIFILAATLVPLTFINNSLTSISLGHKPQIASYGLITFELAKLPLGFLLVYQLEMGIVGALITIIISHSPRIVLQAFLLKDKLIGRINILAIKFWLKMSWLTLYQNVSAFIQRLDILLFSLTMMSVSGLAFWSASLTIAILVNHAGQLSQALYAKILSEGQTKIIEENFKRTLFFAIPILGVSIVFAKTGLNVLNPLYIDSIYIVYFLSIAVFCNMIRSVCYKVLRGFETVDIDKKASFRQYVKSNLFLIPTLNIIYSVSYVGGLAIFLLLIKTTEMTDLFVVTIWSIIMMIISIPFMIYSLFLVYKKYGITLKIKYILKYAVLTLFSSIVLHYLITNYMTYHESIWNFIPEFLPYIALGSALYFGILYLIDKDTRIFYKSIIHEFKKKM